MINRYKHYIHRRKMCRRLRLWQDCRNAEYGSDVVSVLYSRANMWLVPNEDAPQCCPCPDHATNYVSASYVSGRLSLLDENGARFSRTTKSCKVHVGGVSPSKGIGDARLMFSHNGRTCRDTRYTVFGVGISSAANVSLSALNATKPSFGLPVIVGTNSINANLNLDLKVKLQTGRVRLSFANATGSFRMLYHNPYAGEWRTLIDTESRPFIDMDIQEWRSLFRKRYDAAFCAPVAIVSAEAGHCDIEFRYWLGNGVFAEDVATQRITAVNPPLVPDIDRDGQITNTDIVEYLKGKIFRYWTNEDTIKGDYAGHISDQAPNVADLVVNGRCDLINLFPMKIDVKDFIDAWGATAKCVIRVEGDDKPSFNFCFADIPWSESGSVQTSSVATVEGTLLSQAQLLPLDYQGYELPHELLTRFSEESGLVVCEALKPSALMCVDIKLGDMTVCSYSVPMLIRRVKDMYSWCNFRLLSGQNAGRETEFHILPEEDYAKSLIFLHGANVSTEDAEQWGDAVFKRMWLSGMRARFYNIDWRSDIGSPANYHANASNAFVVASQIASTIKSIPGEKTIMAHSLGNMVVSSMIQDHGLEVSSYIMCNSAVPAEAYDTSLSLRTPKLVHPDWVDYPTNSWASSWHRLFSNDLNDDRKYLGWPGRFTKALPVAVNFYSTGDEVLELAVDNDVGALTGITDSFAHHAWHKQELFKGRGLGVGLGATDWSGWNIEENWFGVNKISVE